MTDDEEGLQARRAAVEQAMGPTIDRIAARVALRIVNEGAHDPERIRQIQREEYGSLADLIDATGFLELGARLSLDDNLNC